MPRQIKRKEVEWERASCAGLDTDLFYSHRTGLKEEGLSFQTLRRICMSCPIQRECLTIGIAHEQFGFWGGLSEEERRDLHAGKTSKALVMLGKDLAELGLSYEKVYEHVKSVTRDFTYTYESKF